MLASLLLFFAGILCLATAWYFSHNTLKAGSDTQLARGLVHQVEKRQEQMKSFCTLWVSFTLKNGKLVHHQEIKRTTENWHPGMPVLVQYSIHGNEHEVQRILTFRQAYGTAFIFSLLGILLIISGGLLH